MDTVSSILRDTPASVTELRPDLPNHLGRIVRRCLEKDPKKRLQSAADLSQDLVELEGELSGAIPTAAPGGTNRSLVIGAIVVIVALGLLAAWQSGWLGGDSGSGTPASGSAPGATSERQRTIVVFPFENLGPVEDAYFAAGIAEEIGSRLASVASLGVISRASATQYDRTGKTMQAIGEDLGVDYVLDGTVRWNRSGDGPSRVRVTPQLISVVDDRQMWSERFDETLDEIFEVQSRIAEEVLRELDFQLRAPQQAALAERPTDNLAAYQDYLKALDHRLTGSYDPNHRLQTIALLERAVQTDPEFAFAWTVLSDEQSYYYHLRYDTTQQRIDLAKRAAERALEIAPDLPQAHHVMGLYHYRCHRDYERALAEFTIAAQGLPNDPELLSSVGAVRRRLGEFEQSVKDTERALQLNPRDSNLVWDSGVTYAVLGRYDDALDSAGRATAIAPEDTSAYMIKSYLHILKGEIEASRAALEAMPATTSPFAEFQWIGQLLFERKFDTVTQRLESATWQSIDHPTTHRQRLLYLGDLYTRRGDTETAQAAYRQALADVDEELKTRTGDARRHLARGRALASLGRNDEAIAAAERAVELYPPSLDAFHGPHIVYQTASIYLRAGKTERAIDVIEKVLHGPQKSVVTVARLKLDPQYDELREYPRFQALIE